MIYILPVFFMLGFVHGWVILKLNGLIIKRALHIPNLWAWHSVWGIAWVVLANYWFVWPRQLSANFALSSLFFTFLVAFPGIYIASHLQWRRDWKPNIQIMIDRGNNGTTH